jgi:hypothetical protein
MYYVPEEKSKLVLYPILLLNFDITGKQKFFDIIISGHQ